MPPLRLTVYTVVKVPWSRTGLHSVQVPFGEVTTTPPNWIDLFGRGILGFPTNSSFPSAREEHINTVVASIQSWMQHAATASLVHAVRRGTLIV